MDQEFEEVDDIEILKYDQVGDRVLLYNGSRQVWFPVKSIIINDGEDWEVGNLVSIQAPVDVLIDTGFA